MLRRHAGQVLQPYPMTSVDRYPGGGLSICNGHYRFAGTASAGD
ncbi:hypothetical protein GGQ88_002392 [Novosphingobium hassiacum]|uniref:Uncharacterized protein n=1 Tax=Novosphingobium hassiacum TaxID=173676 RepID=A0A7W6A0P3_9SPHN|nr:hypothetical protein [Novosphingobium hassiacum]MBB3861120.1 hypothetical protein [Novosphingobium hassiacum]